MESGTIDLASVPGPFDIQATLESGQTFLWTRLDGKTYSEPVPSGGSAWYRTVHDGEVIEVRQLNGSLEWRSTVEAAPILRRRLGLDDDLEVILQAFPPDPVLDRARERFPGMRLVREPFMGTLVSFILSAQMRVARIHTLVWKLHERYGEPISWGNSAVHGFPEPETLAATTEAELRDLGVGYRAPYIRESAAMVRDNAVDVDAIRDLDYEGARDRLTEFVGVGPKVADCVLLFSLGFEDPVPLDTWIRTAIEEHFPEAGGDSYAETSRAIRERFQPHPGYAQTYVFHHLRTRDVDSPAQAT